MIRGLLLILDAGASWSKIGQAQRGFLFVFFVHLVPLMALCLGAEAYALAHLGEGRNIADAPITITRALAIRYAIANAVLLLAVMLAGAKVVQRFCHSIHYAVPYAACFRLLAYAMTPLFYCHLLDGLPRINTWICFAIGVVLCIVVLYSGIPLVLRPDPTKAMGIYLLTSMMLVVMSGLAHFLAIQILHDRLNLRFWEQFL